MIAATQKVLAYIKSQDPWWIIRFILVCLGSPGLFFLTMPILTSLGESWLTSTTVSTNVTWLNPLTYFLISSTIYIIWLSVNCAIFRINHETFLEHYVSVGALIASIPGLLHLFIWCTGGMEGNVFGFLFFLPLMILFAINLCMWMNALRNSWTTKEDVSNQEPSSKAEVVGSIDIEIPAKKSSEDTSVLSGTTPNTSSVEQDNTAQKGDAAGEDTSSAKNLEIV